jgi:hypothetical protein
LKCWVKLYQVVPPSRADVVATTLTMNDDDTTGSTTATTLLPYGRAFSIRPIPSTISELRLKVKTEFAYALIHVADFQLKVYEFMRSATESNTLSSTATPLLAGEKVPKFTTFPEPLIVVIPAEEDWAINWGKTQARRRANQFVASIMSDLEEIPESNDMQVMRNVTDLERGVIWDVIIRRATILLWNECMKFLMGTSYHPLLCVVQTQS